MSWKHRYAKANNKYMKNYDKNKASSHFIYLDANILFDEKFIKNYGENNGKGYILEVDIEYSKRLHNLQNHLPFLAKRMKINKRNRLVCDLYGKNNYSIHIK